MIGGVKCLFGTSLLSTNDPLNVNEVMRTLVCGREYRTLNVAWVSVSVQSMTNRTSINFDTLITQYDSFYLAK